MPTLNICLIVMYFNPRKINIFEWIVENSKKCKYNLSRNNMPDYIARRSGIDFSFESYEKNRASAENLFVEAVSKLYGVPQDCIIPTISGSEAIYVALLYMRRLSRKLTIFRPEYEPIFSVAESLGFAVVYKDLQSIDLEDVQEPFACSLPNNPIGTSHPVMLEGAAQDEGLLPLRYFDETFSEFRSVKGKTVFHEGRSIITSSTMVKYYGLSDLKVGWILADSSEKEYFTNIMNAVTPSIPPYSLWISYQALQEKSYFDKEVAEMVKTNTEIVDKFVESTPGLEWEKPDGTPFGFVHLKTRNSKDLCQDILDRTGVLLGPGKYFGDDAGFRLCFTLPPESLNEGLKLLGDYFKDHRID
jgi:aspartate/methionine/tyrosine aminotransferase